MDKTTNNIAQIKNIIKGKTLILGFGREGQSTLKFLKQYFPKLDISVSDENENILKQDLSLYYKEVNYIFGKNYLSNLDEYDVIIKSPGISITNLCLQKYLNKITSQVDIFLKLFGKQTVGITGTKGKSTTTSLLYNIIKQKTDNVLIAGNLGLPLFDIFSKINANTIIIVELSSHQLELVNYAPHISILLNIFQEHLDYYSDYNKYIMAKFNIALKQNQNNKFIYYDENKVIVDFLKHNSIDSSQYVITNKSSALNGIFKDLNNIYVIENGVSTILFSADYENHLLGAHNEINIMGAALAAHLLGVEKDYIKLGISTFKPLKHRLQLVYSERGKFFYNDSISTIPEATIAALKSLKKVDVLILGGYDRGIDYSELADYLINFFSGKVVLTGKAGKRILNLIGHNNNFCFYEQSFDSAVIKAKALTPGNGVCLLSPAASSYDNFLNFEKRGERFIELLQD